MRSSSRAASICALAVALAADATAADTPLSPAPDEAPASPPPQEEVIVYGQLEIARRRAELDRALRAADYYEGKDKGDRTVYRPRSPWRPTVIVHDDGFVVMQRSPVRFGVPREVSPWWNLLCPVAPHVCIRPGGQVVSPRKLGAEKGRVVTAIQPTVEEWRGAIVRTDMRARVGEEVPAMLDAAWDHGVPFDGAPGSLPAPEDRRAAILAFWADRACNPEGDGVRDVVALFVREVVQSSPWPVSPEEVARAEAANTCGSRLDLGGEAAPALDSVATPP